MGRANVSILCEQRNQIDAIALTSVFFDDVVNYSFVVFFDVVVIVCIILERKRQNR